MSENYISCYEKNGSINISEEVISSIVKAAVIELDGVSGLSNTSGAELVELIGHLRQLPQYLENLAYSYKDKYIVDGQLNKVCIGTGIMDTVSDYAKRPTRDGDTHGAGIILTAGMEILAMQSYLGGAYLFDTRPTFNSCSLEMNASAPIDGLSVEYRKKGQIKWMQVRFLIIRSSQDTGQVSPVLKRTLFTSIVSL